MLECPTVEIPFDSTPRRSELWTALQREQDDQPKGVNIMIRACIVDSELAKESFRSVPSGLLLCTRNQRLSCMGSLKQIKSTSSSGLSISKLAAAVIVYINDVHLGRGVGETCLAAGHVAY